MEYHDGKYLHEQRPYEHVFTLIVTMSKKKRKKKVRMLYYKDQKRACLVLNVANFTLTKCLICYYYIKSYHNSI